MSFKQYVHIQVGSNCFLFTPLKREERNRQRQKNFRFFFVTVVVRNNSCIDSKYHFFRANLVLTMVKALELDSKNSTVIQGVNNFASTSFKSKACKYWTAAQTSVFSMHSFNLHCIQVQGSGLICISKSRFKKERHSI